MLAHLETSKALRFVLDLRNLGRELAKPMEFYSSWLRSAIVDLEAPPKRCKISKKPACKRPAAAQGDISRVYPWPFARALATVVCNCLQYFNPGACSFK